MATCCRGNAPEKQNRMPIYTHAHSRARTFSFLTEGDERVGTNTCAAGQSIHVDAIGEKKKKENKTENKKPLPTSLASSHLKVAPNERAEHPLTFILPPVFR